jgi:thioredoxin
MSIVDEILSGDGPMILMLTRGETLAMDLNKLLEAAEKEGLRVVRVNVTEHPELADRFEVGKHPVLLAWHGGEVVSRRSRPWATDADQIISHVKTLARNSHNNVTKLPTTAAANPAAKKLATDHPDHPVEVTDATFIEKVVDSELPVIVDFWAEWCGPCKMVAPIFAKLAKEFKGQVLIAKVDVDRNPMLAQQFRIHSIPTMMFVKQGKIVGQSVGAAPEGALRDVIKQLINLQIPANA